MVSHLGTDLAWPCSTSEIKQELVVPCEFVLVMHSVLVVKRAMFPEEDDKLSGVGGPEMEYQQMEND